MARTILAVFIGLAAAVATMLVLEYLGMSMFPLPPGLDLDNDADLAKLVAASTTGKKLWVLLPWTAASFVGGATAARISRRHRNAAALVVGAFIVAGVMLNTALLPHPWWMIVAGVLLPLPAARLAARVASPAATPDTPAS